MKKTGFILLLVVSYTVQSYAQRAADQVPVKKKYSQKEALDSTGGISMYTKLITALGGDSVTYNKSGYFLQGWNEDYYKSGKLLHRGYYVDGKLVTFKNFFENGTCERSFVNPDPLHCALTIFFESGGAHKQINYYNGLPQKYYEFYESGQPKYAEENDKDMKYLTLKKSWYNNGHLESDLELTELKNKKYLKKIYYSNGQLMEEGAVVLLPGTKQYVKDGLWYSYDSDGKNKQSEKHSSGVKVSSR